MLTSIEWRYNPTKADDVLNIHTINGFVSEAFAEHNYQVVDIIRCRNKDTDKIRFPYLIVITLVPEDMLVFTLASGDNGEEVLKTFQEIAKRRYLILN